MVIVSQPLHVRGKCNTCGRVVGLIRSRRHESDGDEVVPASAAANADVEVT
jgi:hypothetical protein